MDVRLTLRIGGEVRLGYLPIRDALEYYGGPPPETGVWQVDLNWVRNRLTEHFSSLNFGESIETLEIGLEIADIEGWGNLFEATSKYISYRPKSKTLVFVAQLDWIEVKKMQGIEQFQAMSDAIFVAVDRVGHMKRRPKGFDFLLFGSALRSFLDVSLLDQGWLSPVEP